MKEPSFQLRRANKNDEDAAFVLFEEIQLIHSNAKPEIFREPEKDEIFRHFFDGVMNDPDQHLVFACVSGMEIAYIHYFLGVCPESVYKRERLLAHVHALVVANGYRRTGCGSMLLEHVKQAARRHDTGFLSLNFWSFNDAARACFQKSGFTVGKEFMWLDL